MFSPSLARAALIRLAQGGDGVALGAEFVRLPSSGAYRELDVGESMVCTTPGNEPCAVDLRHAGERSVTVRVNGEAIPISLGHFASRSLGNPADDVVSMVNREGLRIGADMTRN